MKFPLFLCFASVGLAFHGTAGEILIHEETLPDRIVHETLPARNIDTGFYPSQAPLDRYTQEEIDTTLAGLGPNGTAVLSTGGTERLLIGERGATRVIVDPKGHLHGPDYLGNPLDHETWQAATSADVEVRVVSETIRLRQVQDHTPREYVRKLPSPPSPRVNVSVWFIYEPTDLSETTSPLLRYTPATVPDFIPAAMVQAALAGAAPGQEIPLATGRGVLGLGNRTGALIDRTVEAYNAQYGIDYIGNPDNPVSWVALERPIQVTEVQRIERGSKFLDQTIHYTLVAPDSTGEVIVNPKHAVLTTIRDTAMTWKKTYFTAGETPQELDPAGVAALQAKLQPGQTGMARHAWLDTPDNPVATMETIIDTRGAVHGVDYEGDPANPASWTALTDEDVVADRIDAWTVATEAEREHELHHLYVESAGGGQLKIVHNDCIGRDIVRTTWRHLDLPLDPGNLPEGVTPQQIAAALSWACPGETVIVARTTETSLLSEETQPLPDIVDTNRWVHGTDFAGDPEDPGTWTAAGAHDVYIDIYRPVLRTRSYRKLVINHLITAPEDHQSSPLVADFRLDRASETPGLSLHWHPPAGMGFDVEMSTDLEVFTPVETLIQSAGAPVQYIHYFPPDQPLPPRLFLRLRRR